MRHQKTRTEIISEIRRTNFNKSVNVGKVAALAANIAVFNDVYGWSAEEIKDHMKLVDDFVRSYEQGNESVTELIDNIRDELGIDLLEGL